jgi:hypothetical protein
MTNVNEKKHLLHNINVDENTHYININIDGNTGDPYKILYIILYATLMLMRITINQY